MDISLTGMFLLLTLPVLVTSQSGNNVTSLISYLYNTNNYNKKVRPLTNQSQSITIFADFVLNAIIGFDEQDESLKTAGYLVLKWQDEYLVWDPVDFDGIEELFLPQEDIWKPDISLRNTFKTFTGLGSSYLNVLVSRNGSVDWNPFQVLESTCAVDITYFPFDQQTCELKFTAWSYRDSEVRIEMGPVGVKLEDYASSSAWQIAETSARNSETGEVAVFFKLKLKRKPRFYIINIIFPVFLLSVLSILTFLLPVSSGEKASYAVTVFLSISVFLTIITSELPKNSENTSLLAVYIMIVSSWSTVIVTVCMIQSRIYVRDEKTIPINRAFRLFIIIQKFFTCKKCSKSVQPDSSSVKSLRGNNSESSFETWSDIVDGIDFVFFWISCIVIFMCTLIIGAIAVK